VRQSPGCIEDYIQRELRGQQPESKRAESRKNDPGSARSFLPRTRDPAPQQEQSACCRNADEEPDEKSPRFQASSLSLRTELQTHVYDGVERHQWPDGCTPEALSTFGLDLFQVLFRQAM
jgi:hypothetical protein